METKLGVKLIAILYAIKGLSLLLFVVAGAFIASVLTLLLNVPIELAAIAPVIMAIFAVIAFAIAYGIYNLEPWGWYAVVILEAINIASAAIQMNIGGLIIPVIILWYLWDNQDDFGVRIQV